jgi:hypothetical protein|tara:strand:- start:517 stop:2661 length:2145 start_codon:yes stop_codon:yes gene_type:complete
MAIMDKPLPEDVTDSDLVIPLTEDGDVEEENLEFSGAVAFVQGQYSRSKDARRGDETRWMDSYRNYRGLYSSEVQFTESEKSKAFIKITKTKVLAAYAQVVDVLFAGSKFPIGIEARRFPNNVAGAVSYNPNALTDDKVKEQVDVDYKVPSSIVRPNLAKDLGLYKNTLAPVKDELELGAGRGEGSITFEPAKRAAQKMENMMHDQLEETQAPKHLRSMSFEACLFGTGIMKGPFAQDKEYPRWDEEGNYDPLYETIPKIEYVSIWDFYPDPDARNMSEAEYTIQRHRLNRTQIRALKKRPHFREESIELALDYGADYIREYWEDSLEEDSTSSDMDRYEVLEYWGVLDAELAEEADIDIPKELAKKDEIQVNIWVCNGQILRLVLNPFTPVRIPYQAVPYELNPYSFFGIGVAENMTDTQLLMNGFMRMAVDNGALSGNLIIEVDETNLVPGQDMSVYPGKVFRRQAGAPGQAIFGTKFPNVSQELLMMFDKSRQLADEATGIPSYSHGSGAVGGVGRTASGMSMLMGAAAQNIKAVVRNIDDYLLAPLGKSLFSFNMQFNFNKEFIGDLDVKARGTESLMRNEVRSQRLLQFMQMTANPSMAPFVKYDYILRELASSMDLDEDKILNDPREAAIQQKMMAEIKALMPEQPAPPPQAGPQGGPPVPSPADPTGNGGGNIAAGAAPEPDAAGFTGGGGGANGGNAPQPAGVPVQ